MRTIFYARVSTAEQTLSHQQAQAEKAGYVFDKVIADHGVSGVSVKLRDRPQGRRLFDLLHDGDTLVVRWVDRLGRNYADVTDTIREFIQRGVVVRTIINGMVFDGATKDPMQMAIRDAQIGFMAAMAQAQAEGTKDAQRAGIDAAKEAKTGAYRGRKPSYDSRQLEEVIDLSSKGVSIAEVARTVGVTRQTAYRIRDDEASARKALEAWTH